MKLSNKNKILLGGFVVLLLFSYHLAIKKTLLLRSDYLSNMEKHELVQNLPMELSALSQKDKQLDAQFRELDLGSSNFQNDLLKFLNENASSNEVKMVQFNAPHTIESNNTNIKTYIFVLEGSFSEILKVVHAIESRGNFGAISHMGFEKKRDYRSGRSSLQSTVHLQLME
ncbi:hypothetical protein [Muricauda sp. MAR_2010_75]|uniref:hypothetical protein n=1 Tax=Allomuricauda sp. MAR_2010_75 TaxID=1250232 RepID=UPI000561E323|nr:hypothetical protein [Muricauda sp. MAR_2010_75]